MSRWIAPKVSRGVPIPPAPKPRKTPKKREYAPSPWLEFLKNRREGDSFPYHFCENVTIRKHAKTLGIQIEDRWFGHGDGRVWIVATPWKEGKYVDAGAGI